VLTRARPIWRAWQISSFERVKLGGAADAARWHVPLANVPEVLAPVLAAVPLHWLALECALAVGADPDHFRRDDPRWDRAYAGLEM